MSAMSPAGSRVSTPAATSPGRRERNKQEKLARITAAAGQLFTERGVDEVTTQEIADRADIGAGTLFLYAKTKGELLLMVLNSSYVDALEEGVAEAARLTEPLDAVMAIVRPVVVCNRKHVENGRTYLRELVYGDPTEPHHRDALDLSLRTAGAIADVLARDPNIDQAEAATRARIVSSIMFLSLSAPFNVPATVDEVVDDIRTQVQVLLAGS
jgi:AcrR family transcriptional regulator